MGHRHDYLPVRCCASTRRGHLLLAARLLASTGRVPGATCSAASQCARCHRRQLRQRRVRPAVASVAGLEDPRLACSARAAVPLLTRLSALLGAPTGPLVLFAGHGGELRLLLASCAWRAPPLERVLLGGAASCLQTALAALQLRPGALAELPRLLQLPAAALIVWRRATLGRSRRRQVRAALLCLLALALDERPAPALGLPPAPAADWHSRAMPLRQTGMESAWPALSVTHLYSELQSVLRAVWNLNEVLGLPLRQLDVEHTLHLPLTLRLGFDCSDEGKRQTCPRI